MRLLAQFREHGPVSSAASRVGRFAVTAIAVGIAAVIGGQLWIYYLEAPWTRDGRVRADVVQIAADVSGLVSEVLVHDIRP
jgi:multidrug resistance efflux pump